ncbi:MAG TPA: 5'-nucleotidase C-terminal domain-containing protein, partial [Polyangia bacterium]|nr:5'-nucleotidase C-terminal domain-containing protein [Polyangia bacterium]
MSHPNAFAKFVGRLDLVIRDGRVRSHAYQLFPVDNTVPEDPEVAYILEDYERELNLAYDLDRVITTATEDIRRFGTTGGDSPLGNLVAEAMQTRKYVETDFAVTNSLGIRTNILEGGVTVETMFNVLPFENTIATMFLSGSEVQELLDYATRRAAGRGCATQVQVSGISFTMNCRTGEAEKIVILGRALEPDSVYEMATNNYMAWGGSGFEMLKRNTTKKDTGIAIRNAVIDYLKPLETIPACLSEGDDGECLHGIGYADGRIAPAY